jgi:uncharacterized membrane protein YeaQ/YmgE (transglycosylase-associated protein family)
MGILAFLVIGLISGWLAGVLTRGGGFGVVGDIIVGIVGALLGGLILGWLGIAAYGTIGSIATAVLGAIIFLWLIRVLRHA